MAIIGSVNNYGSLQGEVNGFGNSLTGVISSAGYLGGTVIAERGLKGEKGDTGDTGATGVGIASIAKTSSVGLVDTYTITYTNGNTATFTVTNGADGQASVVTASKVGDTTTIYIDGVASATITDGADGQNGQDGADGFSPIATVSKVGDTATISITDENGTTTATVTDGADGTNGTNGQDGFSPIANVSKVGDTATISITDSNGTTTATVSDGQDSADENVKQLSANAPSYSYWRPLPVGESSSSKEGFTPATKTGGTYTFPTLQVQPSTGTIRMGVASMFNGSYTHKVSPTTLTANRTATLPNKSGTIAFTDDIPPLVTDLGNIDPSEYEDDREVFLNTLLQDGIYRFVFEDGDDYEYYVVVESMLDNGYVYQKYWSSEEGSSILYQCSLAVEDGEVVERSEENYMTLNDASNMFAIKAHTHYESKNGAMSVFDWCDTSSLEFDNAKPFIIYTDTLNSKNWIIERYTTVRSPNYRFIKVYDMSDSSHFYIRSGSYTGSSTTWGSWREYTIGGGGGGGVSDVTIDGTSIVAGGVAELETVTQLRDGIMTATDKQKLDAIESGAEVNVQSDWNQSTNTADDYIKNKPTIPSKTSDLNNDSGFITNPNVVYCTCATAKATAAKVATIVSGTLTTLNAGDQAIVKFTSSNTSASPTLKIGNTDAKPIMRYGTTVPSASAETSWNAGSPILFVYDGTNWVMCGWLNAVYSEISEANITNASGSAAGLVTGRRAKKAVETFAPVQSVNGQTGAVTIGSDVYIATYNVTSYSDVLSAIASGKDVVCAYSVTSGAVTTTHCASLADYTNGASTEEIVFSATDEDTITTLKVTDQDVWRNTTTTVPSNTSDLNNDSNFIAHDGSGNVTLSGDLTLKGHSSEIGDIITVEGGTDYTTDISASASTWYQIASITLPAGVWVVEVRCRFTPTNTGNHTSAVNFTTGSGNTYVQSRQFSNHDSGDTHNLCRIVTVGSTTTMYLRGIGGVAGKFNRKDQYQLKICAVRIR